ncbi:UDP-N-acetylmuramate:L-alanyl-gamma-D-glutamyl-meso-diaminopimelate ligase [Thiomicrorhabdus lithotrophica]|uniref:UDP-N-acetylmuramate--L-alanyl-gamma-D-glutamyl-meso-2,6-diaminoheptandioate ligase n=1 Tax=Thiomicrorhabdus lithotrophica TaxID=2949997 RepID=A0ABY8C782_9GAMM|nr:UDP-N-acetylmuramate:L-alanyl-gamma-D-glutamyl-meso-diaminopimelate ligase [Thiomicrorhabdus lithotrophica]WEJ61826.1 UDP-N-acetylmuramate:L-alanyl-gamma-D-glutamyl-meso-diaminopimelate ligase [Thiomicrorhabdus lithotrophica]
MKPQKIHILGIAGTFMGGIAQIAKAMGHEVTGSDKAIYPPMSTQLEQAGIGVLDDDSTEFLKQEPDAVVVGNAKSRGHVAVEATLNAQQVYTSGPQWLAEHILKDRWVVAVAGTHGKTSTASIVAWILEYAELNPGFLIGGVPENFGVSARLGDSPFFVVEADEYDTAFFDKRSKFVHYHPRTCVLNNLEFDHADIFDSVKDIQKQFHHLVRTVPGNGLIVMPTDEPNLDEVITQGCWTPIEKQGEKGEWSFKLYEQDGSEFEVSYKGNDVGRVKWSLTGLHNVRNALSAVAAAVHCGVPASIAVEGLSEFKGIRRRMTLIGEVNEIKIYDDFAHHPTAIDTTLKGAKNQLNKQGSNQVSNQATRPGKSGRLIAVFEPRSNTMRMGIHKATLPLAFKEADAVYAFIDNDWNWNLPTEEFSQPVHVQNSYDALLKQLVAELQPGDTVVMMSNGSFGGLHQKLFAALQAK